MPRQVEREDQLSPTVRVVKYIERVEQCINNSASIVGIIYVAALERSEPINYSLLRQERLFHFFSGYLSFDFLLMIFKLGKPVLGGVRIDTVFNGSHDVTAQLGGSTTTIPTVTETSSSLYRVQVGAYKNQSNAQKTAEKMKAKGFDTMIVKSGSLYKVQSGAFSKKANAETLRDKLKAAGFEAVIVGGTSTTATPTSPSTASTDVAKTIWNYLKGKGLNAYAVAGIMGNLYWESGLKPTNLQNTYEKSLGMTDAQYTAAVDNGSYKNFVKDSAGYGLAQWTYWSRKEGLLKAAQAAKKSIGDLGVQLDYLWKELQGYTNVMKVLKSATSVKTASDIILTEFERPADQSDSAKSKRASIGQGYYDKYAGKTSTPAATTPAKTETFKPYTVKVTTSVLNVRKEPTTDSAVTTQIRDFGVYTIVGESTGKGATKWGKLKSGAGWISLDYAKKL